MPPRIRFFTGSSLQGFTAANPISGSRAFAASASAQASKTTKERRKHDPYAMAQSKAKKAANESRRAVLLQERAKALGDPVRGTETEYVRSWNDAQSASRQSPSAAVQTRIDAAAKQASSTDAADTIAWTPPQAPSQLRNFFVPQHDMEASLERSKYLTFPSDAALERAAAYHTDEMTPDERRASEETKHTRAAEALARISSLSNGSTQDRMRAIKQRCIADFGRHNTSQFLPVKPQAPQTDDSAPKKTPAAGPDTGSSEVQIAILTAKIRGLADSLGAHGRQDKMNKRNLRLLVHRRQKLLNYLRRKERGGPRWQHVVQTLGLDDASWQGEISM